MFKLLSKFVRIPLNISYTAFSFKPPPDLNQTFLVKFETIQKKISLTTGDSWKLVWKVLSANMIRIPLRSRFGKT